MLQGQLVLNFRHNSYLRILYFLGRTNQAPVLALSVSDCLCLSYLRFGIVVRPLKTFLDVDEMELLSNGKQVVFSISWMKMICLA